MYVCMTNVSSWFKGCLEFGTMPPAPATGRAAASSSNSWLCIWDRCVWLCRCHTKRPTIQIPHIACNKHRIVFQTLHRLFEGAWRWKFNEIGLTWLQDVCDKSCLRRRTTFKNGWKLGWQTELVVLRSPAADDRAIPTLRSDWSSHFLLASHWSGQSGLHLQVGKIITTETLTKLVWQLVKSQWEGDVKRTNLHRPVWT